MPHILCIKHTENIIKSKQLEFGFAKVRIIKVRIIKVQLIGGLPRSLEKSTS